MNTLGDKTITIIFKGFSNHNLFEDFEAASDIKEGQFVTLDSTGGVVPIDTNTLSEAIIGVAMMSALAGKRVTIAMKGYGTIMAEGSVTMAPGPVKFASFTSGTGYNRVTAAVNAAVFVASVSAGSPTTALTQQDNKQIGWALDGSTSAEDLVRVVVKS
jgi:hypothetical protein